MSTGVCAVKGEVCDVSGGGAGVVNSTTNPGVLYGVHRGPPAEAGRAAHPATSGTKSASSFHTVVEA